MKILKKDLIDLIWNNTDYMQVMSYSELSKKKKAELLEIAHNYNLFKEELVELIWNNTDYNQYMSKSELSEMKKYDLLQIAHGYNLL